MDINCFSLCLKDLISQNDKVAVPGLGLFFAAMMPAKFSDNRAVINPPYRSVYFTALNVSEADGQMFLDSISRRMSCSMDQARTELKWCIDRLINELTQNKSCIIPGLGNMRADSKNEFYFVSDDGLDVYMDGIGFEPVYLKVPEKVKKTRAKFSWPAACIVSIFIIVAAIIVLACVFRDDIQIAFQVYSWIDNVINHLLYNSEELELLGL